MKTLLAIVGGLFFIALAGLAGFGFAVGRGLIPAPQWLTDAISEDAGHKVVLVPSTPVSRALPGRWVGENGRLKGSKFTFTKSLRASLTVPVEGLFVESDCTRSGSYYVLDGYLNLQFTSHDGAACKSDIKEPYQLRDKIDLVDDNRILMGNTNLVRED